MEKMLLSDPAIIRRPSVARGLAPDKMPPQIGLADTLSGASPLATGALLTHLPIIHPTLAVAQKALECPPDRHYPFEVNP
jgi:hypothetical protein